MKPPFFISRRSRIAAVVLVVFAGAWFAAWLREPRFEGRSSREWVRQLVRNQSAARRALLALGPAAAPALARAVEQKHRGVPAFLNSHRPNLPAPLRRLIPSTAETTIRGNRAVEVLFELGTNAAPAVPALLREELRHDVWDLHVTHAALVAIGAAGTPQLARVLRSAEPRERVAAARYLGLAGPAAALAAPALAKAVHDSDPLVRSEAVAALIKMGPAGHAALPELRRSLEHGDPDLHVALLEALWRIGGEAEASLLSAVVADPTRPDRSRAAGLLGEMGSTAAPALPTLSNVLQEEFSYTRVQAAEAIDRIQRSLSAGNPPTR